MPVHTFACPDLVARGLLKSYDDLPADRYLAGDHLYRYRAFGRTVLGPGPGEPHWSLGGPFFQSKHLNSHAGGMSRTFAPLARAAQEFARALALRALEQSLVPRGTYALGCHQIRVVARDGHPGLPTPEGFHRDGFSWVLIACVARHNADGAITTVRRPAAPTQPLHEGRLAVGEALLLADSVVEHHVSPLVPRRPGPAHRDVVVVTLAPATAEEARDA
ncbi:2OG-Fe dioxygenase family protein [Streptomyces sp. NPDC006995]|uniref:2OG-Fe dioxygenase family protein n=1 Tax=Streptomyces sp. NPDC006995 TaxID=3156907 RepID=UPI003401AB94